MKKRYLSGTCIDFEQWLENIQKSGNKEGMLDFVLSKLQGWKI